MALSHKPALSLRPAQQRKGQQEATLIPWIGKGDEAAFKVFYDATSGLLFGLVLRVLGHTRTAEEVLPDLYKEVRQRAAQFGKQNERPLTWLILIAHRRAIETLCRVRVINRVETSHKIEGKSKPTLFSDSFINITEQRRLVRATLNAIPDMQRRMIDLTFFCGMTHLEIAMKLGQSPEAVKSGLRYAMLQLFGLFKSMGFSPGPKTGAESLNTLTGQGDSN